MSITHPLCFHTGDGRLKLYFSNIEVFTPWQGNTFFYHIYGWLVKRKDKKISKKEEKRFADLKVFYLAGLGQSIQFGKY